MYVVFTDPYNKGIRFFNGVRYDHGLSNGRCVHLEGSFDYFIAELMLRKIIKYTGNGEYEVDCNSDSVDSEEVMDHIFEAAGFFGNRFIPDGEYHQYQNNWMGNRVIDMDEGDSVIFAKLVKVADQYGDAVADFELAIQRPIMRRLFNDTYPSESVLDSADVWTTKATYENGNLDLKVRGIGSGTLLEWPKGVKSCSSVRCEYGNARHKLDVANHLYYQIELLICHMLDVFGKFSHPTTVRFKLNAIHHKLAQYRDGWQPNLFERRHLPSEYRTLEIWSEFTPKTPE